MLQRSALNIVWLLAVGPALWACACHDSPQGSVFLEPRPRAPVDPGPVVARVGGIDIHIDEVEPLARLALDLRRKHELPEPRAELMDERLDLAVELLALAGGADEQETGDVRKRLLARIYLDRMLEAETDRPVSDEEVVEVHRDQKRKYLTTGESELFEPGRVDAAVIGVGLFANFGVPADEEMIPVLDRAGVDRLASKVLRACGDRVNDLDEFIAIARRFSKGNPSLRLQHHPRVAFDSELSILPPRIHESLVGLDGNGAISPVIRAGGAAFVIRRGVGYPGRGEDPEEIRDEIVRSIRLKHRRVRLKELLSRLMLRFRIQTWPENLTRQGSESPGS